MGPQRDGARETETEQDGSDRIAVMGVAVRIEARFDPRPHPQPTDRVSARTRPAYLRDQHRTDERHELDLAPIPHSGRSHA